MRPHLAVAIAFICAVACGTDSRGPARIAAGTVLDADTQAPVVGAEIFVNSRAQVATSAADGSFHLQLEAGTEAANVEVAAQGYARAGQPHMATAGEVMVALVAAREVGPIAHFSRYPAKASWAPMPAAAAPAGGAITMRHIPGLSGGSSSGQSTCSACPSNILGGCCACAAGCALQGSCWGLPPPPAKGAPFPSGCTCAASACASVAEAVAYGSLPASALSSGGATPAAPPPDPTKPPPPPSQDYSRVVGDTFGRANVYFNYVRGGLVFADDRSPASDNVADIHFYLQAYLANTATAAQLPFQFFAADGVGGLVPLQGLVGVDVSAYQDGRRLEVTPGYADALIVTLPPELAGSVTLNLGTHSSEPSVGAFSRRGDSGNQWLFWNPNARQLVWPVDHLGTWLIGRNAGDSGGCLQGTVLNACDGKTRVAYRSVRISAVDTAGTRAWTGQAGPDGRYCIDAPVENYWPGMDLAAPQPPLRYFVSSNNILETAMCDPFPNGSAANTQDCRTCQDGLAGAAPEFRLCTLCSLVDPLPQNHIPSQFADTCAPPPTSDPLRQVVRQPCSYCAGTGGPTCTLSDDVPRPATQDCSEVAATLAYGPNPHGGTCACHFAGGSCNYTVDQCCFTAPYDPAVVGHNQGACRRGDRDLAKGTCGRCTKSQMGAPCDAAVDLCCDEADPSNLLTCSDGVCVPANSENYNAAGIGG